MGQQEGTPEGGSGTEEAVGDDLFERWLAHRVQTAEEAEARPRTFGVTGIGARDLTLRARSEATRPASADPATAGSARSARPAPEREPVGLGEWEPVLMPSARKRAEGEDAERPRRLLGRRRRDTDAPGGPDTPTTPTTPDAPEAGPAAPVWSSGASAEPAAPPAPAAPAAAPAAEAPAPHPNGSLLDALRDDAPAPRQPVDLTPEPEPEPAPEPEPMSAPALEALASPVPDEPAETPRERKNRLARERRARLRAEREAAEQLARDQDAEGDAPATAFADPADLTDLADPAEVIADVDPVPPAPPVADVVDLPDPQDEAPVVNAPRAAPHPAPVEPVEPVEPVQAPPAARATAAPATPPAHDLPPQIEFTPRTRLRRVTGILLAIVTAATLLAGAQAYRDGTDVSAGIALVLAVLSAIVWAVRAASPVARLSMHGGILEVHSAAGRHVFDLTNPYTQVESIGSPGSRGWQVRFHRRAMSPFTVTAAMVDPEEFMPAVRYYRPDL